MNYWAWDSSLSVGIDEIDAQHHHIIDSINELHIASQTGDRVKISQVLIGLEDKNYAPYVKKVLNRGWLSKTLTKFFG